MQQFRTSARCILICILILGWSTAVPWVSHAQSPLALPPGSDQATAAITAADLTRIVRKLAGDELEGRAPASRGDVEARRAIAQELAALGLEPGGKDGSWEQPFSLLGITAESPKTWIVSGKDGREVQLAHWEEWIAGSGVQAETTAIADAELVFVGYGITAPEYGWDDFKGMDLQGKVLVMLNNDPDWDPALFAGNRRLYYGRWKYKYESAARQGAVGAILLHTDASAGYPWQVVQSSWGGEQFELAAGAEPQLKIWAWATESAGQKLCALAGHQLGDLVTAAKRKDFHPVSLGIRTSLVLPSRIRRGLETANVLGLLRGSDPQLSQQVVIYTAHHDHLGRGKPNASGDDIYNGARDNASGVAQVLATAKAFRALPRAPRRSILFLLVAGEEQGLLGSAYYAANPTFAAGRIAANVNFDAGNIWGRTRDLIFLGRGKSSLDPLVEAAAAQQGRIVVDDPQPDRGFFYRSDQFSFAKIGVPALYLDGGNDFRDDPQGKIKQQAEAWEAAHYHQPSDEIDASWNLAGMVEDTQAGFWCGLAVAEADALPSWNPGDEFAAARAAALAAVR